MLFGTILSYDGNIITILSSVLPFIYAIIVFIYLIKRSQVAFLIKPLIIFGVLQALIIRILILIELSKLQIEDPRFKSRFSKKEFIQKFTLVSGFFNILQIIMLFVVLRRHQALTHSQANEFHNKIVADIMKKEIPYFNLRVCLAIISGMLLIISGFWICIFVDYSDPYFIIFFTMPSCFACV